MPVLRPWNDPRSRTRPVTSSGGRPVWFAIVNAIAMSSQLRTASTKSRRPRSREEEYAARCSTCTNAAFVSTMFRRRLQRIAGPNPYLAPPRRGEAAPTRANQPTIVWRAPERQSSNAASTSAHATRTSSSTWSVASVRKPSGRKRLFRLSEKTRGRRAEARACHRARHSRAGSEELCTTRTIRLVGIRPVADGVLEQSRALVGVDDHGVQLEQAKATDFGCPSTRVRETRGDSVRLDRQRQFSADPPGGLSR